MSGTRKRLLRFAVVMLLLATATTSSFASHFRYGNMSWKITGPRTVEFKLKEAWRTDAYVSGTPSVGQVIPVDGAMNFGDGSATQSVSLTVTAVDAVNDYFYGEATFTHTYASDGAFTAFTEDCCRISSLSNNADGYWRIESTVTVGNGNNNSPVSTLPIIVNLPPGVANATFNVPASDADGNPLTYRIATSGETATGQLSGLTVSSTGLATFNTVGKTVGQLWNGAIAIEDGQGGKTVVDFLIQITVSTNPPTFDYAVTPANGSVIPVNVGDPVNFTVKASDTDAGEVVTLLGIGVPVGATFTPPTPANPVQANFSWTPGAGDVGSFVITFTATDPLGGQATTSVTIQVNACNVAAPNLSASSVNACQNTGNVTITSNNCLGGTVNWSGNDGSSGTGNIVASTSTLGSVTYSATCTVGSCVSNASQATVTVNAPPSFTTTMTSINCQGGNDGSISVTASGGSPGYMYSKDGGTTYGTSSTFAGLSPGTYPIRVKDANGCEAATQNVDITQPSSLPGFTTEAANVNCRGGSDGSISVTANGGTAGYTYSKDGGATYGASSTFAGLSPGNYPIRVKDANGCETAVQNVTITEPAAAVTATISGNTSVIYTPTPGSNCTTLTANPSGGTGSFTYAWSSGGTGASELVCPESTTPYSVTVTDENGCSVITEVTVNVKDVRCGPGNTYVTICYYGTTQCVREKIADRYLKLGATLGACGSPSARIGAEETVLNEGPFELSVKGYPNPTQGSLTVEVMSRVAGPAQMQVLDLTGRAVQQRTEQLLEGLNKVKFDLTAQPSGTYLIRASDGMNRQGVVRVSKQ